MNAPKTWRMAQRLTLHNVQVPRASTRLARNLLILLGVLAVLLIIKIGRAHV